MSKIARFLIIFLIIFGWIFSGWPQIWQNPPIPPKIQEALAISCGFGSASGTVCIGFITQTASSTWTIPNDWNSLNNKIECVGAGGNGATGSAAAKPGAGGGGGSYAYITNQSLSAGSVNIKVASGGSATSTYLQNNSGTTVLSCGAGGNASTITPGSGGTVETGTGSSGREGGPATATNYYPGGGGGGSAGPLGIGKAGGGGGAGAAWGGGGGGGSNGGSSTPGATSTSATGGNGGNGTNGTGGGIGGAGDGPNATSTTGGGGAGGAGRASGTPGYAGGNGAIDQSFNASYGVGGGGGGGGADNVNLSTGGAGGNGGTYGGGGGGGGGGKVTASGSPGTGGQGLIVVTYTPLNTTYLGDGTNPPNKALAPGATATSSDIFTFSTNSGTESITNVTTTLAGTGNYAGLSKVEIVSDSGLIVFGSVINPSTDAFSISLSGLTASTVTSTSHIRITPFSATGMPAVPGALYVVTSTITAWTGASGNLQSGTDSGSATVTIDNLSPSNVTNATTTPSSGQVIVSWTNSTDTDFSNVLVVRATSTPNTGTPDEGSSPSVGTAIGNGSVIYNSNGTSTIDSGLVNGTPYYYKIFAKDTIGNYSQNGVEVNGTPAVAAVVSITVSPTSTTYGFMEVSSVKKADTANSSDEFIVTNTGNVAETFDIISSDATGGAGWALSTSTVGTKQFMHAYSANKTLTASTTLGSVGDQATKWVALDKGTSYRTLKQNVASSTTQDLVLELLTPSDMGGDYEPKTITVTVRATEYP